MQSIDQQNVLYLQLPFIFTSNFYDEKNYIVKGKHGGKEFRLGQKVKVEVIIASKEKRQIDFAFVGD